LPILYVIHPAVHLHLLMLTDPAVADRRLSLLEWASPVGIGEQESAGSTGEAQIIPAVASKHCLRA
jgi:hypothetical protein